jgi:REP element-mobilizing transposase RayT
MSKDDDFAGPGSAERQLGTGTNKDQECRAGARRSQENSIKEIEGLGWYSRGYLPHADFPDRLQSITYRLADSLPQDTLEAIEDELRLVGADRRDAERRRRLDEWLDAGHGSCVLRDPRAAACVLENWRHFAGERYDLIAWVIMPNHVHVLIRVYEGVSLKKILQSWKSYTARRIREWKPGSAERQLGTGKTNPERCRAGARRSQTARTTIWAREYWDRYIRDDAHFAATIEYIHQNPVKAKLVQSPEEWPYSSASEWRDADMG